MSRICMLCLGLLLAAAASPAAAGSHERRLPQASSLINAKLTHNMASLTHGPARLQADKWGRGGLTTTKTGRGQSMPHLNPR